MSHRSSRWSRFEDEQLRRLYADRLALAKIASLLGRSEDALVARRKLLGITPRRHPGAWSAKADALLIAAAAQGAPASVLVERLGRSIWQVRSRRRRLAGVSLPRGVEMGLPDGSGSRLNIRAS